MGLSSDQAQQQQRWAPANRRARQADEVMGVAARTELLHTRTALNNMQ
jgi:hypothetical protein